MSNGRTQPKNQSKKRESSQQESNVKAAESPVLFKDFECVDCNSTFDVSDSNYDGKTITCPTCHAEYDGETVVSSHGVDFIPPGEEVGKSSSATIEVLANGMFIASWGGLYETVPNFTQEAAMEDMIDQIAGTNRNESDYDEVAHAIGNYPEGTRVEWDSRNEARTSGWVGSGTILRQGLHGDPYDHEDWHYVIEDDEGNIQEVHPEYFTSVNGEPLDREF